MLEFASDGLKDDPTIVLAAVSTLEYYGRSLEFASERLRKDRTIVMEAVKNDGNALEYAGEKLKNNRAIVLAAVRNGGDLKYSGERLRNDAAVQAARRSDDDLLFSSVHDAIQSLFSFCSSKDSPLNVDSSPERGSPEDSSEGDRHERFITSL